MTDFALVPAYNEENNIGEVLSRLEKIKRLQIVVVDDGSTDNTPSIAARHKAKIIRHKKNHGKAEAIRTGLKYILRTNSGNVSIVVIDSDLQYNPEESIRLLRPINDSGANFVTGHRNFKGVPFRHRLGNFVWRTTFNSLFGRKFKDTNCGYVAMNRKAAELISKSIYGGYIAESAMFTEVIKNNLRIVQIPVNVHYYQKSKISRGVRVVGGVLIFIMREGLKYRFGRK